MQKYAFCLSSSFYSFINLHQMNPMQRDLNDRFSSFSAKNVVKHKNKLLHRQ